MSLCHAGDSLYWGDEKRTREIFEKIFEYYDNQNVFLISSIKEITKEKLIFINNQDQLQEIDLFECRKNWVEYYNRNDFITWEGDPAPKITIEEINCVGERDWFAEKPYYKFYSNPRIRFEIHTRKHIRDYFSRYWKSRYYKEFRNIEERLHKVGLSTFDLG